MTSGPWREATVEAVRPMTARVVSVWLRADLPRSVAGQHLELRLTAPDGYQAQRRYSIASAPDSPWWELAIERLDDGEVSPFFHDVVRPGDRLEVRGPLGGHFVWRPEDGGPLLLVAGGSGLVPLMAMLRQARAGPTRPPVLVIVSVREWRELLFRDELLATEAASASASTGSPPGASTQGSVRLVVTTTRGPRWRPVDPTGRLGTEVLRSMLAAWPHAPRHTYVCGATRFVEAVATRLVEAGLPAAIVRTERYGGA